jgi:cytochrome b561
LSPRSHSPFWINVHASVGLLYFVLVIARIGWRFARPPPAFPPDVGEFSRRASHAAHHLLYVLMLAIPVFGFVALVWHGRAFNCGMFQLNFSVPSNPAVYRPIETVHQLLAYALFALAGLHAAVALWHQIVRRDGILLRMLPGIPR